MILPRKIHDRAARCLRLAVTASMFVLASCGSDDKDDTTPDTEEEEVEIVITLPGGNGGNGTDLGPVWEEVTFTVGNDGGTNGGNTSVDIAKVEIKIDGTTHSTITSAPFDVKVNTTTLTDGEHTLEAIVTLTNGKQTSTKVTFTVQNTLVEIQAPSEEMLNHYPEHGPHFFVFLSDEAGKTIAVKEFQPDEKFRLTAPGYTGSTFYLTEVIAYEGMIKDKLITYSQVKRGGKWVITTDIGGGEWFSESRTVEYIGNTKLTFKNLDYDPEVGSDYFVYGYETFSAIDLDDTFDFLMTRTTSPLFITKSEEKHGPHMYYKLIPEVRVGGELEIDMNEVTTPMTAKEITSPFERLRVSVSGLTGKDQFDKALFAGSTGEKENGKYTLYYADIYPDYMYYSSNLGERFEDWDNATRHTYDVEPIHATNNIAIDLAKRKITGSATGSLDVFYIKIFSDFTLWRIMGAPGENRNLVVPDLPEAITKNNVVRPDFPADDTDVFSNVFDVKLVDGYEAFMDGVRSSKDGFNDYLENGVEYKHRSKVIMEVP
jgi:hypothetical protein